MVFDLNVNTPHALTGTLRFRAPTVTPLTLILLLTGVVNIGI